MDPKSDKDVFLGYSINSREYNMLNNWKKYMMESINVIADDIQFEVVSQKEED